ALEAETNPDAARAIEKLIARFNRCAENSEPLEKWDNGWYVFARVGSAAPVMEKALENGVTLGFGGERRYELYEIPEEGCGFALTVAPVGENAARFTDIAPRDFHPEGDTFVKQAAETILSAGERIAALAPIAAGIGLADTADEAKALAHLALYRPADRRSADAVTAECERRILAELNRSGPGVMGLGGNRTALTAAIEQTGFKYFSLALGGALTSFAAEIIC
ncbi:MAG: fumarate hydratase, partial [Oscillospiraceae bacterium]|nr:fumarate hydratase [Oscillospiraceae bacterium]